MEESSYSNLSTSHLLGSVPAVVNEEKKASYEVPEANMQIFPPNNGSGGGGARGYQTLEAPTEEFEQQPPNNWKGVFSISSYTQYFNVDTDVVIYRLICSFYPTTGDFFSKIDANPDLYGLIWITTTLVFMLASFGNFATFLMQKHTDSTSSWSFDVGYINAAASGIYGYAFVVPMAFYFLLQYLGSNSSLVRFWCMWGYSLSIFIPTAVSIVYSFMLLGSCYLVNRYRLFLGFGYVYFYKFLHVFGKSSKGRISILTSRYALDSGAKHNCFKKNEELEYRSIKIT